MSIERANLGQVVARTLALAEADAHCASLLTASSPTLPDRLRLLDRVSAWQETGRRIERAAPLGQAAFGRSWLGSRSNWQKLAAAAAWIEGNADIRLIAARLPDRHELSMRAASLDQEGSALASEIDALFGELRVDAATIFGVAGTPDLPLAAVSERLALWVANAEQLSKWIAYRDRAGRARSLGLADLVDRLEDERLPLGDAQAEFEMAYFEGIFGEIIRHDPEIGRFDGELHGGLAREFANLDRQRIAAAAVEVVRAHHRRIPPPGGIGPLGILRAEMARRRGHMPIRQLMQKAAPAVQALKPVLMMSPLSVAQFLPPGQLTFDLLVMDEASQIQPVDALGAIARCRQVVVVGDERQLPPTRFFAKMTGSEDEGDDDGAQFADIESVLGLFTARGLPQRMLRWHYRSRHQSLIAVSNSQFYENKLFIVPSPYTQEAGMGLRFHHVPEGVFDSGGTGSNAIEAKVVAEAIIRHAKAHPELSLGVATFSIKQRRAILEELEILRRLNPEAEPYFIAHPSEPFFVKNLENVQGDERDVILISVGYARNANGQMAMRFGPLSADGGERRLNVLISRAKRRCEVFASITDEDIDLDRGKGKGVFAFKLFLHYARTGQLALAATAGHEQESPFETQVANALQARGYQVHPKVGIAGFFIDLAIADPERPGRYLLGIECDGPSYHALRSARDRDRLRHAVLEDHGWIIHRLWSADWFQRPQEQLERAVAAIESAKRELDERLEAGAKRSRAVTVEVVTVERGEVTEIGLADVVEDGLNERFYVEASPVATFIYELYETPVGILAGLVEQVVVVEGPVHLDEVVARLRSAWGLQRAGSRIQAAVERAAEVAVRSGRIVRESDFLSIPGATVKLRDRRDVTSMTLRKPEMLPPAEIRMGVIALVSSNYGAAREEIGLRLSRLLGFKSTSAQLKEVIATAIDGLLADGSLATRGDLIVLAEVPDATAPPHQAAPTSNSNTPPERGIF